MSKAIKILGVVLILQLLLAVGLFWHSRQDAQFETAAPLLPFKMAQVDKISIDADGKEAMLQRGGDGWLLPNMSNLPVNADKIEAVLERLGALQSNWPVATTASAQERFEVAADKYQRRIGFFKGDKVLGELLLGSSPGFRKVNLRLEGDDNIYALELSSYELPAEDKSWLDLGLLAPKAVTRIEGPDFELRKVGDSWHFVPEGDDSVDQLKATGLVAALQKLQVLELAQPIADGGRKGVYELTTHGKVTQTLTLFKQGDRYYVQKADGKGKAKADTPLFTLSKASYDKIVKTDRALLVKPKPKTEQLTPPTSAAAPLLPQE